MTADALARAQWPATASSPVPAGHSPYWVFYEEVAAAQLADWLPAGPQRILDVSGDRSSFCAQLVASGHDVVSAVRTLPDDARTDSARSASPPDPDPSGGGRWRPVVADPRRLSWLRDGCVDAVLAESRALSLCLAAEVTAEDLCRVLRPGGRLLLVVDSLVLGLARLADQGRWAELADVPAADVVLVADEAGAITRCFWPEELSALLTDAGLDVEWVRPRSVLSPAAVERALAQGGEAAMRTLVRTECALAAEREGSSTGMHLVVSARKP